MHIISRAARQKASKHVIGDANEFSREENSLYLDARDVMMMNPNSQYYFYFNQPIVEFGVPSKAFKIRDLRDDYINFVMARCRVGKNEAIELYEAISPEPIRTNALKLDIGKVIRGKLIAAIELNGTQHVIVPEDPEARAAFARIACCDMVKKKELEKICKITEIDFYRRQIGVASTRENLQMDTLLFNFIHEV